MLEKKPLHDSIKRAVDTLIARDVYSTIENVCDLEIVSGRPIGNPQPSEVHQTNHWDKIK